MKLLFVAEDIVASAVNFIGPENGCMFKLTGGYVIKQYDGSADRLRVDSYGNLSVSPISISMGQAALGAGIDLDTENFALPINSNIKSSRIRSRKASGIDNDTPTERRLDYCTKRTDLKVCGNHYIRTEHFTTVVSYVIRILLF